MTNTLVSPPSALRLSDADIRWQRPRSADRNPHRRLQPQKRKSLDATADLLRYQIDHDHRPNAHSPGVPGRVMGRRVILVLAAQGGADGCHRLSVGVTGEISVSDRRSDGRG